jgi:hypothetical protein
MKEKLYVVLDFSRILTPGFGNRARQEEQMKPLFQCSDLGEAVDFCRQEVRFIDLAEGSVQVHLLVAEIAPTRGRYPYLVLGETPYRQVAQVFQITDGYRRQGRVEWPEDIDEKLRLAAERRLGV